MFDTNFPIHGGQYLSVSKGEMARTRLVREASHRGSGLAPVVVSFFALFVLACFAFGQQPSNQTAAVTNASEIKLISPGIYELGKVRLDQKGKAVSFPAVLNKSEGLMEYFLVTTNGKTHESILKTDASPTHIHVAMLLLNAKGSRTNVLDAPPKEFGGSPELEMTGDPISIEVKWKERSKERTRRAEELVVSRDGKLDLSKGRWIYNGSSLWQGKFLAQFYGSIIALISDPVALVNNVGIKNEDDHLWRANLKKLPPADTPVQVVIKLR